ncbi:1,4-dihydroxy-2-naphthoate polyprenyltransferase [Planococcus halotolerans]|uniref:1,4-dihydroxy-2-naphthoate octaprenyltransferase n=1 Tax=Planococcus halotolerans TaxID=2233542 RepID=A0A365KLI4_9BACL|nr:1,4-dihydroxy-2-naphthoate polyprenyltransferase [Planococcus halotolerans]QHJ71780.1 1,4-dihydroxy-2-naphthoate polyprenyltransferase [Planococcus halotolerans]RAZ74004.1 1,4-dihydroxy-2-naphthoate octaprenyltransferase [Planococcus halotolerans]
MTTTLQADSGWRVWWQLTRPHTLTASFAPVFLGTMIAIRNTQIDWGLFTAMLIASLLIQAATNMFNEYYDFARGLDNEKSVGIGGAIVRNGVKPKTVLGLAFLLYGIAGILGIYICMQTSWWLLVVGGIAMMVGYLYTGGPYPIAYTPFGELFSGLFMGFLIVIIAFYIQTGTVTIDAILLSIPSTLLVAAIMMSNNIRDIVGDAASGRKTLAILAGRPAAVNILLSFFVLSYAWIAGLVLFGMITPWALLVFISIIKPVKIIRIFKRYTEPLKVMPAMKDTGITNTLFAFLLAIGLLIGHLI